MEIVMYSLWLEEIIFRRTEQMKQQEEESQSLNGLTNIITSVSYTSSNPV